MTWHSQAGQDRWVYEHVGSVGFFVDVGAHDGVIHSNSYALEQAGWTGLCVEPDPEPYERLRTTRQCTTSNMAAGARWGTTTIQPAGTERPMRPLDWLLDTTGAPETVDYLSIDVEGAEMEVLAGIGRYRFRLATVEHNTYLHGPALKDAVHLWMTDHGYERAVEDVVAPGYGAYEDWWINART